MTKETEVSRSELMKLARELGQALAQSQEILDYRDAEKEMADDEEASHLMRVYRKTYQERIQLQTDPENKKEEIASLSDSLEKADRDRKANSLIAKYDQTGNAFQDLIYQINQVLKFYCMEPDEDSQFGPAGGCRGCKGCPKARMGINTPPS
ncbi:MAG TPA: hypothetical protein DDW86_05395 [Clostridiales bacterium]|jgi:cell fate (sporulation/competence/biofilm development) regulator YlbF (YheA/YmcA/DUF963 family)|nr:hypothetical protein [Clostridiales bacterium]